MSTSVIEFRNTVAPKALVELEITRSNSPKNLLYPAPGFHYRVVQPNLDDRKGFADLAFYRAEEFSDRPSLREVVAKGGFCGDAKLAELVNFYPHGRKTEGLERQLFRKGVGSILLDLVIADSIKAEAQAIVVGTTTIEVRKFLTKHGFQDIDAKNYLLTLPASTTLSQESFSSSSMAVSDADWRLKIRA